MFPSCNMSNEMEFRQQWEFRTEHVSKSSSDESKSSSSSEPAHKKHKLVSSLILLENEEAVNDCSLQQNGEHNHQIPTKSSKGRKVRVRKMDTLTVKDFKRNSNKRVGREKGKACGCEDALDDLRIFMKSLLEDLEVTREDLFTWMKEEMQKLESYNTDMQPGMREGSSSDVGKSDQVHDDENLEAEEGMQVDLQNDFGENIHVQHQNNSEEKLLIHNQNCLKVDYFLRHQNSIKDSLFVEDREKLEESSKVKHRNNFEENMQLEYQNNFEFSMTAWSLEGSIESNEETAGFDNRYQTLEELADYGQEPMEKYRGEKLASPIKPNNQSPAINHDGLLQDQKSSSLSGKISQDCNGGSLENFGKGKRINDFNCYQVFKRHDQEIESTKREQKERLGLSAESNSSSHSPNQIVSSMCASLPTVLSDPQYGNQGGDVFSHDYIQSTVAENRIGMNSSGGNLMPDSSPCYGHFSGTQQEDRKKIFGPKYSGNVGLIDEKSTFTSTIGTGFPILFHEGTESGFGIPSQISFENVTRVKNNTLCLTMDRGAIRFLEESYALSEHYNT